MHLKVANHGSLADVIDVTGIGGYDVVWPVNMRFRLFYHDPKLGGEQVEFLDAYFYHTPGGYDGVKRNGVFVNHFGPYSRRAMDPGYNVSSSDLRKLGAIPDGVTLGTFLFRHLAVEIKARTNGTNGKTWAG